MTKKYIVGIRNIKDKSLRSLTVVDSLEGYLSELRAFVHSTPTSSFSLFPDEWEVVSCDFDTESFSSLVSFANWKKAE